MTRPLRTPRSHRPMSFREEKQWIYTKTDPVNPKKTRAFAVTFVFYKGSGRTGYFTRGAAEAIRNEATTPLIIQATAERLAP